MSLLKIKTHPSSMPSDEISLLTSVRHVSLPRVRRKTLKDQARTEEVTFEYTYNEKQQQQSLIPRFQQTTAKNEPSQPTEI
jgi:hypothetical protein